MMSVAESVQEEKDDIDLEEPKNIGLSAFKATNRGFSQASQALGKTAHSVNYKNIRQSCINTVDAHHGALPVPKKFQIAAKKKALEEKKAKAAADKAEREAAEAAGIKLPKKPRVNKFAYPTPEPLPPPKPLTVAEAMAGAKNWNAANVIANKYSCGTVTTASHKEKAAVFAKMNPKAEQFGSLYPQSNYFGEDPSEKPDPYSNRKVKELNDIEFDEDSDWEEVKNLKRQPRTVLNEENLREFLCSETLRLNLENHYWIKNNMISNIGRMAPNLMVLSLRRMKFITNPVFAEVFKYLVKLERIDLTDCLGLLPTACQLLLDKNRSLSHV